jgi:hypothetical protein
MKCAKKLIGGDVEFSWLCRQRQNPRELHRQQAWPTKKNEKFQRVETAVVVRTYVVRRPRVTDLNRRCNHSVFHRE